MGEIVEMILEGLMCEKCGEYIDGNSSGFPRKCSGCKQNQKRIKKNKDALHAMWDGKITKEEFKEKIK